MLRRLEAMRVGEGRGPLDVARGDEVLRAPHQLRGRDQQGAAESPRWRKPSGADVLGFPGWACPPRSGLPPVHGLPPIPSSSSPSFIF